MRINPKISPILIQNLAQVYQDPNRVIMEYVDNAFDAFQDYSKSNPSKSISISIKISGRSHNTSTITISDNCSGIENLSDILSNIGNSVKKTQYWTNGQFGFGIFSFMAICAQMKIISRYGNNSAVEVEILKNDFSKESLDEIYLNIRKSQVSVDPSTTTITLREFDKSSWQLLDALIIKDEIEKHFELLIQDNNISVKVERSGNVYKCNPFEADANANIFESTFDIFDKEKNSTSTANVKLIYTPNKSYNRPPVFISKKRRIIEVAKTDGFNSKKKGLIWKNQFITGYVDAGELIKPLISRNSIKKDNVTKELFQQIIKLEKEIINTFDLLNPIYSNKNNDSIEKLFNKTLSNKMEKFLKELNNSERGDDVQISNKDTGNSLCRIYYKNYRKQLTKKSFQKEKTKFNINKNEIYDDYEDKMLNIKDKSGILKLRIDEQNLPVDLNGNPIRSSIKDHEVFIYKNHTDYQSRLIVDEEGKEKFSETLLGYILMEYLTYAVDLIDHKRNEDLLERYKSLFYLIEHEMKKIFKKEINIK